MPPDSVQDKPKIIGECCCCNRGVEEQYELRGLDDGLYCEDCYNEVFTQCEDCGEVIEYEYANNDDNGYTYCNYCWDSRHENVDLNSFDNSLSVYNPPENTTFEHNKFERFVGVEIETLGPSDYYPGDKPDSFYTSSDGSVGTSDEDYGGYEFISQPMCGDTLFSEIDKMGAWLRSQAFRINKTCGLHIHIDARDLYYKELKGIMLVTKAFESTIFSMLPSRRYDSNWCKSINMSVNAIKALQSDSDFIHSYYDHCDEHPSLDKYNDARYQGLNLHARVYLGTIEFRYHSGTNNPTKIKNWITICQSIVEKGIALSREFDNKSEDWDADTHLLMNANGDLGLQAFVEILELDAIKYYILRRVCKFDRPSTEESRQYMDNEINFRYI